MNTKFKAIIFEHAGGTCKHLFYIWMEQPVERSHRLHRELYDSGMRTDIDECLTAIEESVNEYQIEEPKLTVTIVNS